MSMTDPIADLLTGFGPDAAVDAAASALPWMVVAGIGQVTAGLLASSLAALDEYVGVSNANMHLLAGIGKTARVLVPYPGEWRWMRRAGPSPWFPNFSLYRQPQSRDWSGALQELRGDLFKGRNAK